MTIAGLYRKSIPAQFPKELSMGASSGLFDLIKSMTSQEKRYFRLYARTFSTDKENKITRLFDAIDQQEQHDEALLQKLAKRAALTDNLASAKFRLKNLILDSLGAYHRSGSISADLRSMLTRIEILYHKRLFDQCRRLIESAKKKAAKFERFEILIELQYWERRYLVISAAHRQEKCFREHYRAMRDNFARIGSTIDYLDLMDQVQSVHARYSSQRAAEDSSWLQNLADNPLLLDPDCATTFVAKTARLETIGFHARFIGDYQAAYAHYSEALQLWDKHPFHIEDNLGQFKSYLANFLDCCIALRRFDEFEATLARLQKLPAASREAEIRIFEEVAQLELGYYLNRGRLDEGLQIAQKTVARLPGFAADVRPNRLASLYYNCMMLFFLSGRWSMALTTLNEVFSLSEEKARRDIQDFALVFRLLLHYQLGHYDTLERYCDSTARHLNRDEKALGYEKSIVSALRKLSAAVDRPQRDQILLELGQELVGYFERGPQHKPLGLVEILTWVQSRLQKRPIAELFGTSIAAARDAGHLIELLHKRPAGLKEKTVRS